MWLAPSNRSATTHLEQFIKVPRWHVIPLHQTLKLMLEISEQDCRLCVRESRLQGPRVFVVLLHTVDCLSLHGWLGTPAGLGFRLVRTPAGQGLRLVWDSGWSGPLAGWWREASSKQWYPSSHLYLPPPPPQQLQFLFVEVRIPCIYC